MYLPSTNHSRHPSFTSQPVAKFYDSPFLTLDSSFVREYPKTGRKGFSNHSMICAFIVMKCEGFSMITDLVDYLNDNLLIAHYCGFDISLPLPSYWTFDHFLKNFNQDILSGIMHSQVLFLSEKGIIDTSFIGLDSTPVSANTSHNNPKSFLPCCPFKLSGTCPINHVKFHNGRKNQGCTKWITIPNDLRLFLDRNSKYFKSCYSLCTECERYNSRFKNTGQERMWVRNKSSVANLNTFAHISLLAVAVASVAMSGSQSYRKLKSVKRTA